MAYPIDPAEVEARIVLELAFAPWGGSAACIDAYETSVRALTDLQWTLARVIEIEPAKAIAVGCADLTRDIAATQVSSARWLLDV
jgi:hypothetical protein